MNLPCVIALSLFSSLIYLNIYVTSAYIFHGCCCYWFHVTFPKVHMSEGSLVRRSTCPKVHLSEGPHVRRFTCPKIQISETICIDKYSNFMTDNRNILIPSCPTVTRSFRRNSYIHHDKGDMNNKWNVWMAKCENLYLSHIPAHPLTEGEVVEI